MREAKRTLDCQIAMTELTKAEQMQADLSIAKRHAEQLTKLTAERRARVRKLIEELLPEESTKEEAKS